MCSPYNDCVENHNTVNNFTAILKLVVTGLVLTLNCYSLTKHFLFQKKSRSYLKLSVSLEETGFIGMFLFLWKVNDESALFDKNDEPRKA